MFILKDEQKDAVYISTLILTNKTLTSTDKFRTLRQYPEVLLNILRFI